MTSSKNYLTDLETNFQSFIKENTKNKISANPFSSHVLIQKTAFHHFLHLPLLLLWLKNNNKCIYHHIVSPKTPDLSRFWASENLEKSEYHLTTDCQKILHAEIMPSFQIPKPYSYSISKFDGKAKISFFLPQELHDLANYRVLFHPIFFKADEWGKGIWKSRNWTCALMHCKQLL